MICEGIHSWTWTREKGKGPHKRGQTQPSRCLPGAWGGGERAVPRSAPLCLNCAQPNVQPPEAAEEPRAGMAWRSLHTPGLPRQMDWPQILPWPPSQSCGQALVLLEVPWLLCSEEKPDIACLGLRCRGSGMAVPPTAMGGSGLV